MNVNVNVGPSKLRLEVRWVRVCARACVSTCKRAVSAYLTCALSGIRIQARASVSRFLSPNAELAVHTWHEGYSYCDCEERERGYAVSRRQSRERRTGQVPKCTYLGRVIAPLFCWYLLYQVSTRLVSSRLGVGTHLSHVPISRSTRAERPTGAGMSSIGCVKIIRRRSGG